MKWGLSGQPVPGHLPYADACNRAAAEADASPCALYAIGWRETIGAEVSGWLQSVYGCDAAHVITPDGGHGVWQLTSEVPQSWYDPYVNALCAARDFYNKAIAAWHSRGFTGPILLRLAADDFNAGDARTLLWHNAGDADHATTGYDYGRDVVVIYGNLIAGRDLNLGRP